VPVWNTLEKMPNGQPNIKWWVPKHYADFLGLEMETFSNTTAVSQEQGNARLTSCLKKFCGITLNIVNGVQYYSHNICHTYNICDTSDNLMSYKLSFNSHKNDIN
jgi:hypothetical protein